MSVNNRRKVVYEITFIENEISESKIDHILSDPFYKQRMLKSIMIDKVDESKKKLNIEKKFPTDLPCFFYHACYRKQRYFF